MVVINMTLKRSMMYKRKASVYTKSTKLLQDSCNYHIICKSDSEPGVLQAGFCVAPNGKGDD